MTSNFGVVLVTAGSEVDLSTFSDYTRYLKLERQNI